VCLLAIFAPSFLLVLGALPFWERLRRHAGTRAALAGVNAAVVGLLLSRSISRSGPARSMPPPISRWHCSRWLR
jgi:chromate transport protein ChrA